MTEAILTDVIKAAIHEAAGILSRGPKGATCTVNVDEAAFSHHMAFISSWSEQISLRAADGNRDLDELHVALDASVHRKPREARERDETFPVVEAIGEYENILMLGPPGCGKTTTVKYLIQRLIREPADQLLPDIDFPLLIRCREFDATIDLFQSIFTALGVRLDFSFLDEMGENDRNIYQIEVKEQVITDILNAYSAIILVDGVDEASQGSFKTCVHQLSRLLCLVRRSRFFITSRTAAITTAFDHCQRLWLCPLADAQTKALVAKWLKAEDKIGAFFEAASASPYRDSLDRPLNVAQLCLIYDAYGEIPDPPVTVYQRIIQLYLEEWNREQDTSRSSMYASFGPERKRQFLGAIAFEIYKNGGAALTARSRLEEAYRRVHRRFNLPAEQMSKVVEEIESHTGLLSGDGLRGYEFSHKSLQEFLVADYIVRAPDIWGELDQWRKLPDECAIATALSSDPSQFLWTLVRSTYFVFASSHSEEKMDEMIEFFWVRYLARVATEKPGFEPNRTLVLCVAYLDSLCWYRPDPDGTTHDRAVRSKLRPLMDILLGQFEPNTDLVKLGNLRILKGNSKVIQAGAQTGLGERADRDLPPAIRFGADILEGSKRGSVNEVV